MLKYGFLVCGVMALATTACSGEQTGLSNFALMGENRLGTNALGNNALGNNALGNNALGNNALGNNSLGFSTLPLENQSAIQDPGPDGDNARELLQYMVSCAFTPEQSFHFTWTDSQGAAHNETYWGLLGLEPSWSSGPLSSAGQRWISACLAARVNWYHTTVTISLRGSNPALATTATERQVYNREEGVFWGNFFDPARPFYACHNGGNVTNSRLQFRDCAAGHVGDDGSIQQCGIIRILGDCSNFCTGLDSSGQYRPSCQDDQGRSSSEVVTIFLPTAGS